MTGWAPLIDAAGEQFGALGIDVDASVYLTHLQRARFWALLGALPATLLILLGSLWFHRARLRALVDARVASHAARALAREQQRLRNVIDGTRVGVWEAQIDPETRAHYISVDERWAGMLGRHAGELNPLTPDRFIPLLVHPEDAPGVLAAIEAALGEQDRIFDMDARMRHADGRWVWTEVRGKVVERDAQGRPLRMVGTQMDVSDRKAAELSLQEQQGSFRSLFELSPVGICLSEFPAGRFLNVNDAMAVLVGYSRDELLQLNFTDITPDEYRESDLEQVSLVERNTRFGPYVKEFMHKAGHRVRVIMSGVRMKDAGGRDVVWTIVQDFSAR
jgi:PAS domain S-box-containing protein